MLITKTIEIDMGHRVPNHKSKCRSMHGHRYKIEVGVEDKLIEIAGASDEGMVIDFGDLKQIMVDEIDAKLDHGFMMYNKDEYAELFKSLQNGQKIIFVNFIPTAENIAKYIFQIMKDKLLEKGIGINHVTVWETPTSTAHYSERHYFNEEIIK